MNETVLFEDLLKISGASLNIKLEAESSCEKKPKISITSRKGFISKTTLGKIIAATNKSNANLKLLSHGIIEITFKEDI